MTSFSSKNRSLPEGIYRRFSWAGAYAPILMLFFAILIIGGLSRVLLVAWQFDRVVETSVWPDIFLHGLRVDLIMAGMAVVPLLILLPILGHRFSWTAWKRLAGLWALVVVFGFLFMELATPTFMTVSGGPSQKSRTEILLSVIRTSTLRGGEVGFQVPWATDSIVIGHEYTD